MSSLAASQQLVSGSLSSSSATVGAGTFLVSSGATQTGISGLAVDSSVLKDGHHSLVVNSVGSGTANVSLDGTAQDITLNGSPVTIGGVTFTPGSSLAVGTVDFTSVTTTSTATASDLASALNSYGGPAVAAAVDLGGSQGARLMLTASATGTAGALTVTGTGGLSSLASGLSVNRAASDAVVQMGGMTITRSSNSITDLIPGATIQLLQADPAGTPVGSGTDVTLTIGRDPSGTSQKAQALVDAVNGVFSQVGKLTSYDQTTKTGGPLLGDSRPRQLVNDLNSALGSVTGDGKTLTLAQIGIQIQRDGTYTFDAAQMASQLAADPNGTVALLSKAANAVATVQQAATGTLTTTGWIKTAQDGAAETVKSLQASIDDWTTRLATIQDTYTKQFTALDVAVNSLRQQQNWLTGQLSSLTTG